MQDISLHILDIAENSISAGARRIEIILIEDDKTDRMILKIIDNGCGMRQEEALKAKEPFFTTRTTRKVGLGLSLLSHATEITGGNFNIEAVPGVGTSVTAEFVMSHIDRKPIGDLDATLKALVAGNPGLDFVFRHVKNSSEYILDTGDIRSVLEGKALNSPEGISILTECLKRRLTA